MEFFVFSFVSLAYNSAYILKLMYHFSNKTFFYVD